MWRRLIKVETQLMPVLQPEEVYVMVWMISCRTVDILSMQKREVVPMIWVRGGGIMGHGTDLVVQLMARANYFSR